MLLRFFFLFSIPCLGYGQMGPSAFMILKKGNKTVGKYYQGTPMFFYTTESMPVSGVVNRITRDSIFLYQYQIQRIQRADGSVYPDTIGRFQMNFSIGNIGSFPAGKQKGRNLITDGTLLMLAGGAYLVLNIFNTTREGDPPFGQENLPNVLTATGVAGIGYLLKKSWPNRWYIGRKYKLIILGN